MATDATGTPSTNRSYPKYLTSADAPSGVGLNNIIDAIDADVQDIVDNTPTINGSPVEGDALVYDSGTGTWRPSSVQTMAVGGLAAGTDGQVLTTNGSAVEWAAIETDTRYRLTSTVDVVNTTTETALVSQSIGAGVMGTDKMLRLTMGGDVLTNNSAADTVRLRIKFGGTTILDVTSNAFSATSANRRAWTFVMHLANLGANNSQFMWGNIWLPRSNGPGAATTGLAELSVTASSIEVGTPFSSNGTHSIDTSSAQTLEVSLQWSAASVNNSWRKRYAIAEIV